MQYVTHWRMHLVSDMLRDKRNSVLKIAKELGYKTETAFRRAFKRVSGIGPGEARRNPASSG